MSALGLLPAASEPRATSAIAEILSLVDAVLQGGHAYEAGGAVYFDVTSFGSFGQLSHLGREEMLVLARERGGNPDDPNKDDPLDFVLWQPSAPDEPSWESRWGPGRPGWHVECSALALRELGRTVDIHGGGNDLVFPHHECEAAQSEAVTGQPLARHWMHAGMVGLDGEKMSKSLGNLVFVEDLLKRVDAPIARLALMSHHYREDWEWNDGQIDDAGDRLESWRAAAGKAGDMAYRSALVASSALSAVRDRLDDDLDVPGAIGVIDEAAAGRRGATRSAEVAAASSLLGVQLSE
jgi:L-cysteine:1D-myo-inositol 2-amino-2-deoxy-alpha-D-glucopyranoside ligase